MDKEGLAKSTNNAVGIEGRLGWIGLHAVASTNPKLQVILPHLHILLPPSFPPATSPFAMIANLLAWLGGMATFAQVFLFLPMALDLLGEYWGDRFRVVC